MSSKLCALVVGLFSLLCSSLTAANLKVNLAPSAAVSAGAQWQVDGGAWKNSGTTVKNLSNGTHTVTFKTVSGWFAPAPLSVTLSGGTTTLSATYVRPASLTVNLTPTSGQWRVDGGAWIASGATAIGLASGDHTIEYLALSGYSGPAAETVSLTAGQNASLSRSYVQLAQISITLQPAAGQWRADGGPWQTSGTTLPVLPGEYILEYSSLSDYDSPESETITLATGGAFTATRSYTSQKPTLQINLEPSTGQWRVNGGTWQASGAVDAGLDVGNHTVDYSDIGGSYNPIPSETVSLALRQKAVLTRSYPVKPPASVSVSFNPSFLSAQWRIDSGEWQNAGTTVYNLAYDVPHTVEFAPIDGYVAPQPETFTLISGESRNITANYLPLAFIGVSITPDWLPRQWRINGGEWLTTNTVDKLAFGVPHTVEFAPIEGYVTPLPQTVTLASGESRFVEATYLPLAQVGVSISPSGLQPQWRLNGGEWLNSYSVVSNLPFGVPHTIEFAPVEGYVTPPPQTVTLSSGESRLVTGLYTLTSSGAELSVSLNPTRGQWRIDGGAWLDHGAYVTNLSPGVHTIEYGALPNYASPPTETVTLTDGQFLYLNRDYVLTPSVQYSVAALGHLGSGSNTNAYALNLSGMVAGISHLASGPARAFLYRDGAMQSLGTVGSDLYSFGYGLNDDGEVVGMSFSTPSSIHPFVYRNGAMQDLGSLGGATGTAYAITNTGFAVGYSKASSNQSHPFIHDGTAMMSLGLLGSNEHVAYAINQDGTIVGVARHIYYHAFRWQDGVMEDLSPLLNATDSFAYDVNEAGTIVGYRSPVAPGGNMAFRLTADGVLQDLGSLGPNGSSARAINNVGHVVGGSSDGSENRAFVYRGAGIEDLNHLVSLPGVTLANAQDINDLGQIVANGFNGGAYLLTPVNAPGGLQVDLTPATALWRVDGGAWQPSGSHVLNLAIGDHTIEYSAVAGHASPPTETVTISSGRLLQLDRAYTAVP